MIKSFVFLAVGSAAATLTVVLLLLRAGGGKRMPALAHAMRRATADRRSLGLVLVPLIAVSIAGFANIERTDAGAASNDWIAGVLAAAPAHKEPPEIQVSDQVGDDGRAARALQSLRAYADRITEKRQEIANTPVAQSTAPVQESADLPDVDTMISRLASRLANAPDDADGWKMLGWSYLNTGKTDEAVKAYQTALKLKPGDAEIKQGLDAATAGATASQSGGSAPTVGPSADDIKATEGLSGDQRSDMIRGMVNRLATRLESSPNDEDGWIRLMRARMVLGEKDAAKAALTKALETFASDTGVKDRLTASARELGVESN